MRNRTAIIRDAFPTADTDRRYPTPLPAELDAWHFYTEATGHCIAAYPTGQSPQHSKLVAVPVAAVLTHGWRAYAPYVCTPTPYDARTGVLASAHYIQRLDPPARRLRPPAVGEPYRLDVERWHEHCHVRLTPEIIELVCVLRRLTEQEIAVWQTGRHQYALAVAAEALIWSYRVETLQGRPALDWSDVPWVAALQNDVPGIPGGRREPAAAVVTLVHAETGITAATRTLALSEEFADALRRAVDVQLSLRPSAEASIGRVHQLYADYGPPERLAAERGEVRWANFRPAAKASRCS